MGKYLEWNANLLGLNVPDMDKEHQILIDKMNDLVESAQAEQPFAVVNEKLDDLAKYTVEHFKNEEEYMESIGFEGLASHKIIHKQLLERFEALASEAKAIQKVSDSFFVFLKVWLQSHIRGIDMKYAEQVNTQKVAA